jgi:hypothetical protein
MKLDLLLPQSKEEGRNKSAKQTLSFFRSQLLHKVL